MSYKKPALNVIKQHLRRIKGQNFAFVTYLRQGGAPGPAAASAFVVAVIGPDGRQLPACGGQLPACRAAGPGGGGGGQADPGDPPADPSDGIQAFLRPAAGRTGVQRGAVGPVEGPDAVAPSGRAAVAAAAAP